MYSHWREIPEENEFAVAPITKADILTAQGLVNMEQQQLLFLKKELCGKKLWRGVVELYNFTHTQKQRLRELDADPDLETWVFDTKEERDKTFLELNKSLTEINKKRLLRLKSETKRPYLCELKERLARVLRDVGFTQIVTPTILSKGFLHRMTITRDHPLYDQVFWIDNDHCLRPMLAPNLYHYLKQLGRLWDKPVSIFEIGSCFRKESKGSHHLEEFTMLNLVEMGEFKDSKERLKELIELVMQEAGIEYQLIEKESEVYGITLDVMAGDTEIGSAAIGPHPLDSKWGIIDPWVGVGFGLERMVMIKQGYHNIMRAGRSLMYLDGARLNI